MNDKSVKFTGYRGTAILTGASGYLGQAILLQLISDGWFVACLVSHRSKVDFVTDSNAYCVYTCDCGKKDEVEKAFASIELDCLPIKVGVHVAWEKPRRGKLYDADFDYVKGYIERNVGMSFLVLSSVCRALDRAGQGGVVVGVTTSAIEKPVADTRLSAYVSAKYALRGILDSFRHELRSKKIRIVEVCPGFLDGGMNDDVPKAFVDIIKSKSPSGRIATREEVAQVICDICSGKLTGDRLVISPEVAYS